MSETPMVRFSTVNDPDKWEVEGFVLEFASAKDAKNAEGLFAAQATRINTLQRDHAKMKAALEQIRHPVSRIRTIFDAVECATRAIDSLECK